MKHFLFVALLFSSTSYGFICELGTCTEQCTSPDSLIGEQPLPSRPDINNGNYVDCVYACIDLKEQFQCTDGTTVPWIEGKGSNLDKGYLASIPVYEKGTFRAYAEPGFTPMDRELIKEAFDIAFEQLGVVYLNDPFNSEFAKCAQADTAIADFWGANFFDVNTYGFANIWREPRQPYQRLIPGFPGIKYDVRVVKLWDDDALGRAQVGNQSVARPVIALNWNNLKGYTRFNDGSIGRYNVYSQPGFWASTIVHEILHTAGYDHQSSINWNDPVDKAKYLNTFMVKFANCIEKVSLQDEYDPNSKLFKAE
jgi:hypothetical protein